MVSGLNTVKQKNHDLGKMIRRTRQNKETTQTSMPPKTSRLVRLEAIVARALLGSTATLVAAAFRDVVIAGADIGIGA